MTTVASTFTVVGVSSTLRLRKALEDVAYAVTGTFVGSWSLERSIKSSELAWETVAGPFTGTTSGVYTARPNDRLRFRCLSYTSGTITYTMSDGTAIYSIRRNDNNEEVERTTEDGSYIVKDLVVAGTLTVGGSPVSGAAASETVPGILEIATSAEVITGTDNARAVSPAGLAALTGTTARAGLLELATDGEAQTGTDTARAITAANLQAVTGTETRKGVLELATNAEAVTGTDTARATTPAGVAAAIAAIPGSTSPALANDSVTSRTGAFTAVAGIIHRVDTSGGTSTPTMPAAPADKTRIRFDDFKHSFGTNNVTVTAGAGDTVMGAATFTGDVSDVALEFTYDDATNDWELV